MKFLNQINGCWFIYTYERGEDVCVILADPNRESGPFPIHSCASRDPDQVKVN